MTEMIIGGRQTGKTATLIKKSAETGVYIMVSNRYRALQLVKQAKEMGYSNIPFPVTVAEYLQGNKFQGSSIRRDGLYIDDVDDVIRQLFYGIDIKAATFNPDTVKLWTIKKE